LLCISDDGGLTNAGLQYIGENISNVRWILLGNVSQTGEGLLEFSKGFPSLRKLEMRKCHHFSEIELAEAVTKLFENEISS